MGYRVRRVTLFDRWRWLLVERRSEGLLSVTSDRLRQLPSRRIP